MEYVVVCKDGRDEVLAARRIFKDVMVANRYASTIAGDRKPRVVKLIDYLIDEGWRIV